MSQNRCCRYLGKPGWKRPLLVSPVKRERWVALLRHKQRRSGWWLPLRWGADLVLDVLVVYVLEAGAERRLFFLDRDKSEGCASAHTSGQT